MKMNVTPLPARPVHHAPQPEPLLSVKALTSHYGRIQALHGVDLRVGTGQLVALVGANGAGKTTLLRAISGVQPASGGGIDFMQGDISRMAASRRVRLGISQVPEGRQVFAPMTVEDNLRLGAFTRSKAEAAQSLASMYELFPILKDKRHLPAGTLSGGQQQMLAMARALMASPKLLLLDEPSMGLAPLIVREIFELIRTLRDQGITILVVEQNARAALSIADQGYVMELGRIVMSGPGSELLSDDRIRQAYLGM
jgi:branched-chain amino acid transport system ATP-binding protein